MRRERSRLYQELIDQRRLAVVDMGNDGDVAKAMGCGHGALQYRIGHFTNSRARWSEIVC